ncbi:hypothetical protein [Candidatus Binatus sp.]|uniref:hypothetical protein n=2 Tax=Candidatus Binatus sp. TaxID=2811406 RepID=UPI003C594BCF
MKTSRLVLAALFLLVVLFGFIASSSAGAKAPLKDPHGKITSWTEFNAFDLKVTSPDVSGHSTWQGEFDDDSSDIQLVGDTFEDNAPKAGKILLIGGRVLAIQGSIATPGYEMDALDSGVLQYQLVLQLLGAAVSGGPAGLKGVRDIDFSQQNTGIKFATSSAQAFIAPPWRVKGVVKMAAPDAIEFDLEVTTGVKGKPLDEGGQRTLDYSGHLSRVANARLDDSMVLDGWSLFGVGPYSKESPDGTVHSYGAQAAPDMHKTIAAIRADIRAKQQAEDQAKHPTKIRPL